jgi:hypothetical protein
LYRCHRYSSFPFHLSFLFLSPLSHIFASIHFIRFVPPDFSVIILSFIFYCFSSSFLLLLLHLAPSPLSPLVHVFVLFVRTQAVPALSPRGVRHITQLLHELDGDLGVSAVAAAARPVQTVEQLNRENQTLRRSLTAFQQRITAKVSVLHGLLQHVRVNAATAPFPAPSTPTPTAAVTSASSFSTTPQGSAFIISSPVKMPVMAVSPSPASLLSVTSPSRATSSSSTTTTTTTTSATLTPATDLPVDEVAVAATSKSTAAEVMSQQIAELTAARDQYRKRAHELNKECKRQADIIEKQSRVIAKFKEDLALLQAPSCITLPSSASADAK